MSKEFDEFNHKFKLDECLILESSFWRWSVRPVQCTLGAGVLSMKRYCERMSDITEEEARDLKIVTQKIESSLMSTFTYQKINYLMFMMVDPHLHFHVIPRYSKSISFAGCTWNDSGWPALPNLGGDETSPELLGKVRDALKA